MTAYTHVGPLPKHQYCWVDTEYTHTEPQGFVPAVWYGLVSYPGRVWGCTVMLESGAIYRNIPIHAIATRPEPSGTWIPQNAQTWDCYGWAFTALEYPYLHGLECKARANGIEYVGKYLFTVAPLFDGFSAYPDQAKEFMFVALDNGYITVQPTNHLVFRERSFTSKEFEFPKGLKRQTETWSAE